MAFALSFKKLRFSIINDSITDEVKKDSVEPFSFVEFVRNLDVENVDQSVVVQLYNDYLIQWFQLKKTSKDTLRDEIRNKYVELLKTIQLDFLNQDEERILGVINFDDPLETEAALPFFVEKIKDLIFHYSSKRKEVSNSRVKWSTKGSKEFVERTISDYIIENYVKTPHSFQRRKEDLQELSAFLIEYRIEYDGLYDLNDYRELPVETESAFENSEGLNEERQRLFKKYISANHRYNGDVIKTETPFYDYFNVDLPYISLGSNDEKLLNSKEIGHYFTSKYAQGSTYFSERGINLTPLSENKLIADPEFYGNQGDYVDFYFNKKTPLHTFGLANRPVSNKHLKRGFGYRSRETVVNDAYLGVSRFTDNVQLWEGDKNESWANEDVFDKFDGAKLNRKGKNDAFFPLGERESVYKYAVDYFGNEFYLIKRFKEIKTRQSVVYPLIDFDDAKLTGALGQINIDSVTLSAVNISSDIDPVALQYNLGDAVSQKFEIQQFFPLGEYNLKDVGFYPLENERFKTGINPSTVDDPGDAYSVYDYYYTNGRIFYKNANSDQYGDFYKDYLEVLFPEDEFLQSELRERVLDINIQGNDIIITTESKLFFGQLGFDFNTGDIIVDNLTLNIRNHYNDPAKKTSKFWYSGDNDTILYCDVEVNQDGVDSNIVLESTVYVVDGGELDIKHQFTDVKVIDEYDISFESISQPSILKNQNKVYITVLVRDIYRNSFIVLMEYKINSDTDYELIDIVLYNPSVIKLDENLSSDPLSAGLVEPEYSDALNAIEMGEELVYRGFETNVLLMRKKPESADTVSKEYYDNDQRQLVSIEQPDLKYKLTDFLGSVDGYDDEQENGGEKTRFYNLPMMYSPSHLELDYRDLDAFDDFLLSSFDLDSYQIYQIIYSFNEKREIRNVIDVDAVDIELFDEEFVVSPINSQPVVYNQKIDTNEHLMKQRVEVEFRNVLGYVHRLVFNYNIQNVDYQEYFAKVELLDTRFSDSGIRAYLNSKSPNYINPVLLNFDRLPAPDNIADYALFSWGSHDLGRLGNGQTSGITTLPTRVEYSVVDWVDISVGNTHTIAIKNDGTLWAWGRNNWGEVGDGTTGLRSAPVQIGSDSDWKMVSAGDAHSLAIKTSGTLWAWGFNGLGQLGDGTTVDKLEPIQIGSDSDWKFITGGELCSLAIKDNGTLWAWGDNVFGQLGDGTTNDKLEPTQIGNDSDWKFVVSHMSSFGIKKDGKLFAWGFRPVGDGTDEDRLSPVRIGHGVDWKYIDTHGNRNHAITSNGELWAWGKSSYMGDGVLNFNQLSPVRIGNDIGWEQVSNWGFIGAFVGNFSLAVKNGGELWAWGHGTFGKLGHGDFDDKIFPTRVGNDNNWKTISAGSNFSVGLKTVI